MISKQKLLKLRILTPPLQNLLVVLSEGLPFSKKKRKKERENLLYFYSTRPEILL